MNFMSEAEQAEFAKQAFRELDMMNLRVLIEQFVFNPNDPEISFNVAYEYDKQGQTASALSYYLRAAERADDNLLKYEALIRGSMCYEKQGTRKFTVKGMLQQAITVCPDRPEAYLRLSQLYESDQYGDGRWFDSYTTACLGLAHTHDDNIPLMTDVKYRGRYQLLFQKAHTGWWCGLCDDARSAFQDLLENYEMDDFYTKLVEMNLEKISGEKNLHKVYTDGL